MLFGYGRLEGLLVEPFTKEMGNASTVGTDKLGADGSLVDFNQQIEVSEWIGAIFPSVVQNVVCRRI